MFSCGYFQNRMGKLLSKSKTKNEAYASKYKAPDDHCSSMLSIRRYPPVHHDAVNSVAAVGPGLCLSGSKDQSLILFDFKTGKMEQKWAGHEKEITKVLYSAPLQSYFSASRDKKVHMWQQNMSVPTLTFTGHDLVVTGLTINQESNNICTGSRDNSLRIWDVHTGQMVTQNSISRNLVTHVQWGRGRNIIAQSGEDKEFRVFDGQSLQVIHTFPRKQYIQTCCDISEDCNYCLSCSNGFGGSGCEATLWDLRTNQVVCEYKGHRETTQACMFIPASLTKGRKLIATSSSDCSIKIWDQNTHECLETASLPGSGPLSSIAAFSDGSMCVSSFNTGVHVFELTVPSSDETIVLSEKAQY